MPHVPVAGCRLAYEVGGAPAAPALLLLHALGTTAELWSEQREPFRRAFRVIDCDLRGHGRSPAPDGPYSLDRLGRDAVAILDAAGIARAHVCGVSLGGLIALWLGVHAPARVGAIVAANTAARLGTRARWADRLQAVRDAGTGPLAEAVVQRWFTAAFRRRRPETVTRYRRLLAACPEAGYAGGCAVLRDADLGAEIHRIAARTLVVVGTEDEATPPAAGDLICARVAGARRVALPAAHLSNVEQPARFTSAVLEFLTGPGPS